MCTWEEAADLVEAGEEAADCRQTKWPLHLSIAAKRDLKRGGAVIIDCMVYSTYLGGGGGQHAKCQRVAACCAQVKHSSKLALAEVAVKEGVEVEEEGGEGMGACSRKTGRDAVPPRQLVLHWTDDVLQQTQGCRLPPLGPQRVLLCRFWRHRGQSQVQPRHESSGAHGGEGGGGLIPKSVPTTSGRPNGAAVVACSRRLLCCSSS